MIAEILTLGGLGALASLGLGLAAKKFHVDVDPRIVEIDTVLPKAQCGACGFPGCMPFAEAVVAGKAPLTGCTVGGAAVARAVAAVMGQTIEVPDERLVSRILCKGDCEKAVTKFDYEGADDCNAAVLVAGGNKSCVYGCLGLASCVKACPFDAMYMSPFGIPVVIEERCTGCTLCVEPCPKDLVVMIPETSRVVVECKSHDKGAVTKKGCEVGCTACNACVKICPYDAITLDDNVAVIDSKKCTNCGLCIPICPTDSITDFRWGLQKAEIYDACTGCQICAKVCPTDAIKGDLKMLHVVDLSKCISCGICVERCPVEGAMAMVDMTRLVQKPPILVPAPGAKASPKPAPPDVHSAAESY